MELSEKIYMLRKERGLTLEQVGNYVGVGKSTVRKWENGMIENMRRDKISKLAQCFCVSPSYLMGWENDENKSAGTEPSHTLPALSEEDEAMLNTYLELSDDSKRVVRYTVNMYAKSENINIDSFEKRSV